MKKVNKKCHITGKIAGLIYLGIALFVVAMVVSYIRVDIIQKGMFYAIGYVKTLSVVILLMLLQFVRWFFYSLDTDDKIITIKKLGRCTEFEKSAVTSIYSVDFVGTIIEYDDKKAIIHTGKSTFLEKLSENSIHFSDDVIFARMRNKGHITVRPKWYALLFRFFHFALAIIIIVGVIFSARDHVARAEYELSEIIMYCIFSILAIAIIWWFNRSFVYINEEYIWQGLLFPREKYSWHDFNKAIFRDFHVRGLRIEILSLCFKDSKKKIRISVEDFILNKEDLYYLLKLNGIPVMGWYAWKKKHDAS